MNLGHTLFLAFIAAWAIMLLIGFWVDKLGGHISLLGYFLIYLASFAAAFLFILFASAELLTTVTIIGIALIVLTLIINLISQS